MRKVYIFSLLLIFVISGNAQVNLPVIHSQTIHHPFSFESSKELNNKTTNCIDTVRYPFSKLTSMVEVDSMNAGYIEALSQAYHFTGNGLVHGISSFIFLDLDGIPYNTDSISMIISIYTITDISTVPLPGYPNKPTVLIASDTVDVFDIGFEEQALMFSSPVAVNDSFAVVLELNMSSLPPSTPYYGFNGYGDGNAENLSWVVYAGFLYNVYTDWAGSWDSDMLLHPIFEQDITSSYITDKDSICPDDSVIFTNTSVNCTDAMFNNFNTTTNPLYTWDFNDGTGTYNVMDTSYIFNSPGTLYNTELTTTYYGYTLNCNDVSNHAVTVFDTATANFGFIQGGVSFMFYDSSSYAYSYSWDFGDGSPLDNSQNPVHTFPIGNYQVCLTVTDSNGCNVDVFCDSVDFTVGVTDFEASNRVNIYPIPAKKYFNVNVPSKYIGGKIVITDVVGKKLKTVHIENQEKIKVLTTDFNSGVYFVSIDYNGERVFTKRIVIDR
jgi:PKD repeat protein